MGEHNTPSFRMINPSGRIPVIVDHIVSSDDPFTLTQTGAILIYLAEKYDKLLPKDKVSRARTFEWLMFQGTDITASLFNAFFLLNLVELPQVDAAALLRRRAVSFYKYFNRRLKDSAYLACDEYTIADIAVYPVIRSIIDKPFENEYENLKRWLDLVGNRPAVIRGMSVPD